MSDSRKHSAGKGDKPRPTNISKYVSNFDQIKWPSKTKKDLIDKNSEVDKVAE